MGRLAAIGYAPNLGEQSHRIVSPLSLGVCSRQMLWLQTFGGPIVYGNDGNPKLGAAQRRNLGLISVLAVAGPGGLGRDKIVGLLWPDVTPRRARHSLTQALYIVRKSLDCDDLIEGIEDLRLNPARIRTDVGALDAALSERNEEEAARLYRGPFLDQLFPATTVFERWVDSHRASYEERMVAAYKVLVERANAAADHAASVQWLRELAAIRPTDSAVTLQLMNALVKSGDAQAAVRRAHLHTRIRRDDYDLEADETVVELAEHLRSARRSVSLPEHTLDFVPDHTADPPTDESRPEPIRDPVIASGASLSLSADLTRMRDQRTRVRKVRAWVLVFALPLLVILIVLFKPGPPELTTLSARILVAPFRIVGGDASLDYLREGMVELLSTRLADDSAAPTLDAGAVIRAWRRAGVGRSSEPSRDSVVVLAARLGAERVIIGSIVGTARRAVISASVINASSGEVHGEARVEGPVDSLTALVDRLAAQLLASQAGLQPPLAQRTSASLPALRAFLAASSAYTRGDFAIAMDRYQVALEFDSAFAIAALRLGLTARQLNSFPLEHQALAQAWRFRSGLNQRDYAHLTALLGPRYPAISSESETLAAWEDALRSSPGRPEVLFGFAAHVAQRNGYLLTGHQQERSVAALDRALVVDPTYSPAHLLRLMLVGTPANVPGPLTPVLRWRLAIARADTVAQRQIADSLPHLGPANLRALAAATQFDAIETRLGSRAVSILRARNPAAEDAMDLLLAEYSFRAIAYDTSGMSETLRAMQRLNPATRAHLRLRVLDGIYGTGDSTLALLAAQELDRDFRTNQSRSSAADGCVLGQWHLARGDTGAVRSTLMSLLADQSTEPITIGAPASFCVPLLSAGLSVYRGQANAREQVLALDSLVLTSTAAGDLSTYGHIAISRLHRRLGNVQPALLAVRRRPYLAGGWSRYLATSLVEEGELAQLAGDAAGAVTAYTRYLTVRSDNLDARSILITTLRDSLSAQLRNSAH
jgi:DNA-binding SARP family transcriptional activator/tetratricopeptide (TPR) repeat protein